MNIARPLLTIVVPTYNRAASLEVLLNALGSEFAGLKGQVAVIIGDNASTDHTPEVTQRFLSSWDDTRVVRHDTNIGPEENFCRCVELVTSEYFWIVGDDDCPKRGVISQVLRLLLDRRPALVYMRSEWLKPVTGPDQGEPVGDLKVSWMNADAFAKEVHVWVTFISGMVIHKERLDSALKGESITRFTATHLVQLGWVLPLLKTDGPFAFVHDTCVLATKDNSGGYGLLTVFGVNFAHIVSESFGQSSPLARRIIHASIVNYLPGLVWTSRSTTGRSHSAENPWPAMQSHIGRHLLFWLLLVPLGRFPRWLAHPFYQSWRVYHRLHREWHQFRQRSLSRKATA